MQLALLNAADFSKMQQISSIYLNIHDINKGGQTLFIFHAWNVIQLFIK